jgi:hypothetical protein
MKPEVKASIESAKRLCNRCYSYKTFKPGADDKDVAKRSCKRAYEFLKEEFNESRKRDVSFEELEATRRAKTLCLDAIDACDACTKERPQMKDTLLKVR